MKLEELDFTVRTYNCLRRAGIETTEQLQSMSTLDLLRIRSLGRRSLEEIEEKLAALKLKHETSKVIRPVIPRSKLHEGFYDGAQAMRSAAIREINRMEMECLGVQRSALIDARFAIERIRIAGAPVLVICEGYQAFRGTMEVMHIGHGTERIEGDWLYKPDTNCWYCRGRSYPVEICKIWEEAE